MLKASHPVPYIYFIVGLKLWNYPVKLFRGGKAVKAGYFTESEL